jgi:hypothetical protein
LNYILHSWPSKHSLLFSGLRYMIDLFATCTVMHVPQIVCVCYSTVNIGKCKQQLSDRNFASYDYNKVLKIQWVWGLTSDRLPNK